MKPARYVEIKPEEADLIEAWLNPPGACAVDDVVVFFADRAEADEFGNVHGSGVQAL